MSTDPGSRKTGRVLRPARSMGVEYVKGEADPTKVHGVVLDTGESMWRAECMCCGVLLKLYDSPGPARAAAIRHADSASHHAAMQIAKRIGGGA